MLDSISQVIQARPRAEPCWRPLLVLLVSMLLALPLSGVAQTTQTLSLESGWNTVSLYVQPDDSSFATLFNGTPVSTVKNEDGEVYLQSEGVEQISTWKTDEGYRVYSETETTLGVLGAEGPSGATEIALEKGGNIVPYLATGSQTVEQALVSIEESLVVVEDGDGVQYDPSSSSSPLDSLRPGQGYEIYVDQPDTLIYPIRAETLMGALSLDGVQPGQYIRARGRDEPGDGGGGTFVVTDSACETDGATCFMFDEDLTAESYQFRSGDNLPVYVLEDVPDANISWRSFEVRYGPDSEDVIHNRHLHGHYNQDPLITPHLDTETGAITDGGSSGGRLTRLENLVGYDADGDPNSNDGKFIYNYSHTSSSHRLERKNVTNSVKPEWWGAPKADPNNPVEVDPYLRWAATKAQELRDQKNLSEVFIDLEGTYYYLHGTLLPSNVTARGVGSLNHDSGMPAKYQDDYTKVTLRALPGEAMYRFKSGYDRWSDPDRARMYEGTHVTRLRPFRNAADADNLKYEALKVDGNVRNNMQVFNNLGDYDNVEQTLQDSGEWTAWYTIQIGQKAMADNSTVTFEDLNVVDMGGSGISHTSQPDNIQVNYKTIGNVEVYDGRRNHLWYGLTGTGINNITLQGQFWGAPLVIDGRVVGPQDYSNITLKNIDAGQFGYTTVVGLRGKDNPGAQVANLDNFTIDLAGADDSDVTLSTIRVGREGTRIDGVDIEGPSSFGPQIRLFDWTVDHAKTKTRRAEVKNITVTDNGKPFKSVIPGLEAIGEDITVQTSDGVSGTKDVSPIVTGLSDEDYGYARQHRTVMKNLVYERSYSKLRAFQTGGGQHPKDTFFIGGEINNSAGGLTAGYASGGDNVEDHRVYLENFTFNMGEDQNYHGPLAPDGKVDFFGENEKAHVQVRNCTGDFGGGDTRPSDNSGTFTTDASHEGQDYVDIDPNLLSHPWARSATVTSGNRSVTGVDAIDQNGNIVNDPSWDQRENLQKHDIRVQLDQSIASGETLDIDWTARVTPKENYTTTGLFAARDPDQTGAVKTDFTSGNGPYAVDLRGIVGTQESWEPVVYSAASEDTSVVTANVQSDDYTLELTEQGTGTATITVTGEISGVGTATTTFEVTLK